MPTNNLNTALKNDNKEPAPITIDGWPIWNLPPELTQEVIVQASPTPSYHLQTVRMESYSYSLTPEIPYDGNFKFLQMNAFISNETFNNEEGPIDVWEMTGDAVNGGQQFQAVNFALTAKIPTKLILVLELASRGNGNNGGYSVEVNGHGFPVQTLQANEYKNMKTIEVPIPSEYLKFNGNEEAENIIKVRGQDTGGIFLKSVTAKSPAITIDATYCWLSVDTPQVNSNDSAKITITFDTGLTNGDSETNSFSETFGATVSDKGMTDLGELSAKLSATFSDTDSVTREVTLSEKVSISHSHEFSNHSSSMRFYQVWQLAFMFTASYEYNNTKHSHSIQQKINEKYYMDVFKPPLPKTAPSKGEPGQPKDKQPC